MTPPDVHLGEQKVTLAGVRSTRRHVGALIVRLRFCKLNVAFTRIAVW
jgi:hypothetical protein